MKINLPTILQTPNKRRMLVPVSTQVTETTGARVAPVKLDADLLQRVRLHCAAHHPLTMKEFIENAVRLALPLKRGKR